MQKELDFLLEKYSVDKKAVLNGQETVSVDGTEVPLFSWRNERRFIELKNIVNNENN